MKQTIILIFSLLLALAAQAQSRITRQYTQCPLPEVLIDIDKSDPEVNIRFIYNVLEDYTVTCSFSNVSSIEAIQQAVGFYPIKVMKKEHTVIVEPVYEKGKKLIGRVVDEKGNPLEFANVALYTIPDSSFITGGVTNKNGDFVIPCNQNQVIANISFIGYETLVKSIDFPVGTKSLHIGTVVLTEDQQIIGEVVVEQTLASTSAEKSEYLPSKKQKNAATDATSLLQHMQIPQLRLNPLTGYVTTLTGESVSIFIDFMPATQEDLEGMNTQDVKRVDIYDYPKDVRFKSQPHVINFVMQKYEVGGYTKLMSKENVLADFSANNSVYSKLSHKNWTFDANVTSKLSNQNHLGSETVETFKLPTQTVTRTETFADGTQRNAQTSTSLRATYQSEKMQIANRIEILDDNTPKNEMFGNVLYHPNLYSSSSSISRQDSRYLTPTYEGDCTFFLPKQWMLGITPKFQYSHNKLNRLYQEGKTQTLEYNIKEDVSQFDWQIALGKTFAQKHTLLLGSYGIEYGSRMDYRGSTLAHQEMNFLALGVPVKYLYQNNKLNLSTMATALYQHYNVNDEVKSDWAPAFITLADYAFNPKNKLQATFKIALSAADGSLRNPSVMQENEILFYNGNPQLDNYNYYLGNLQYTWMPSNLFTATAYVEYVFDRNYYANVWKPYLDGKILQTIENVGDMHTTEIGASFTLRLLNGNLQLNASPNLSLIRTTGKYEEKGTPFALDINASYYIGNFYFNAGYETPDKSYKRREVLWKYNRSYYYLTAGWGNARWKAKLDIVNPFRTDWRDVRTSVATPLYSMTSQDFNSSSHQSLIFTLTYTFNYGKKVKQGNELGTASGGQSSIL